MDEAGIVVTVRDRGIGLTLDGDASSGLAGDVDHEMGGLGLPVIRALTSQASWSEPAGGGTEVRMRFLTHPLAWEGVAEAVSEGVTTRAWSPSRSDSIMVTFSSLAIARKVLPRLMQALAARLHFTVERHTDVQSVGSALLGERDDDWTSPGGVQAHLAADADSLLVAVGPLTSAAAARLSAEMLEVDSGLEPMVGVIAGQGHELRLSVAKTVRQPGKRL
jgi:hypothetical protein